MTGIFKFNPCFHNLSGFCLHCFFSFIAYISKGILPQDVYKRQVCGGERLREDDDLKSDYGYGKVYGGRGVY